MTRWSVKTIRYKSLKRFERASKEKFKAQVQLRGPRLNVASLATSSLHHLAPDWVSRVRRPAREDTTVSGYIYSVTMVTPTCSNKSSKKLLV